MRSAVAPIVVVAGAIWLAAHLSPQRAAAPAASDLTGLFPASVTVDQFILTPDEARTIFVTTTGDVWRFDRAGQRTTRLADGPAWDLSGSSAGDVLAFTKGGEQRGDQFVWTIAIDPATGQPRGAPRRLGDHQGDAPSVSPDGSLVAFARDEASGVGQSLVVAPIRGGSERVVVASLPSSVSTIRWTPDGRTLFFGVNPPVACVPEWSCLPLAPALRAPLGTIRRVAASGGDVATVASVRSASPGLSPDGTTLMFTDAGPGRRWIIANADGTTRDALTLPPSQTIVGWLRDSTLIVLSGGPVRRFETMTVGK